jgi:chaperone required for assembly of F1-ATPase
MRDIFEEIFENQPLDPEESARRSMRPNLRARFYQAATVGEGADGFQDSFQVLLDGRPVRTPARRLLAAPARVLAQALAEEWDAQKDRVDPAGMPLTRLANSVVDGVAPAPAPVAAEIERYLGTDLVCYRAPHPAGLVASQRKLWDPVVDWAREALGARFVLAEGIVHVPQPPAAIAAAVTAIPKGADIRDAWRLGALNVVTTLTGSGLIALALAAGRLGTDEAWAAAHVDEDWNMSLWGRDEVILTRRAYRFAEMQAAASVLTALR